jgi:hypothetical protein
MRERLEKPGSIDIIRYDDGFSKGGGSGEWLFPAIKNVAG